MLHNPERFSPFLSWTELSWLGDPELSTLPKHAAPYWPGRTSRHEVKSWKGWEKTTCDQECCSPWACWSSEGLHCSLCKETAFSFVTSEAPPAFRRGRPHTGPLWWHTGGVGEPWIPLVSVNFPVKQSNCRLHNCCEQSWCLHDPLRSSLASAHLPQLSQRSQPNSDLTSPQPHQNNHGFIWIWIGSGPGLGSTGMVRVGVWSCTQIPASALVT